jgi:ADP-glucose pyrophosphorylase
MCIPAAIEKCKVRAYIFQGYWEDIGNNRRVLRKRALT